MHDTKRYVNAKLVIKRILLIFGVCFAIFLLWFFVYFAPWACYDAKESECRSYLYQLGHFLDNYYLLNNTYPNHVDKNGRPTWSWRTVLLIGDFSRFAEGIDFNEPWDSPHNLPILKKLDEKVEGSFACRFLYPNDKRAAFVAVTGEGTSWSEISKGNLTPEDCKEMIVFIETPTPRNHWAQPGDDASPEEVIRMYAAYQATEKTLLPPSRHPAKRFVTVGCKSGTFDDIKNVEELKKRLVIDPHTGIIP